MLIYVDAPKFVKVFRGNPSGEGSRRIRLGVIMKVSHDFREDLKTPATPDEKAEIAKAIEIMSGATEAQTRADVLRFPEIARQVAEYYATSASEFEKGLISTAALELTRAVRKADKDQTTI
jgi:hypothetical protein